jgi:glyoxylase-like metal-dependent hydrolase (beta-lactamase superfamily II)
MAALSHREKSHMGESITVGNLRIIALTDTASTEDMAEMFPEQGPGDWADFTEWIDEYGQLRDTVNYGSFLIVSDKHKVLVDTGIGPVPFDPYPDLMGNLVPTMRDQCGYGPEDVDIVFATHMHFDHIGWHVTRPGGPESDPVASFPNAKYIVPKRDWEAILDPDAAKNGPHGHDYSEYAADVFDLSRRVTDDLQLVVEVQTIDGDQSITDEIVTVDTPGHTPGHQSLMVGSGGERVFVMGDAIHLPLQLDVPERVMSADIHPQLGAQTRKATVEWLEREGLLTAVGHFPAPGFGHIVRGKGKRYWQALG